MGLQSKLLALVFRLRGEARISVVAQVISVTNKNGCSDWLPRRSIEAARGGTASGSVG